MKILVREARPSDKAPLMEFIRHVWGGTDYIPDVWDDWIEDAEARMFVVEADGVPVGMNRVRFQEDGSAWFEGVRIHPDYRGMGLASVLGENSMRIARARGVDTFRLTSSSFNRAAHRQVAKIGFKESARISVYDAPASLSFRQQSGVKVATEADTQEVERIFRSGKEFGLASGVYWDSYTATALTHQVVARRVADGSVFVADGAAAVGGLGSEGSQVWMQVGFVSGPVEGALKIVKHLLRKRRSRAAGGIVYVPHGSRYVTALKEAGLARAYSLVLFERKAAKG